MYDRNQCHPGDRMCPSCYTAASVKYVLRGIWSGRAQMTCNSLPCQACFTEYCLNCGQAKGGGRGRGYHPECGRQPSWLGDLEAGVQNDDPRVQRPPPLLMRELKGTPGGDASAEVPAEAGAGTGAQAEEGAQAETEAEAEAEAEMEAVGVWRRRRTVMG